MNTDLVEMRQGVPMVSSLQVAERFGKQHKDVLRAIQSIGNPRGFTERNFAPSEYDGRNGKNPMFWMTKDGFSLLVMGFTGPEATEWKITFIDAFNRVSQVALEADVRAVNIPQNYAQLMEIQQRFFQQQEAQLEAERKRNTLMIEDRTSMLNRMRSAEKRADKTLEKFRAAMSTGWRLMKDVEEMDDQDDLMAKADAAKPALALVKKDGGK